MHIEAIVVVPPDQGPAEALPVAFYFHGFSNWPTESVRFAQRIERSLADPAEMYPRMVYVFPRAYFDHGNHEFADSANNGPWGEAFCREFLPALESAYNTLESPHGRFLSGHSSGGWGALWLQVTYPDLFGGAWCASPDSVDFRDFTGIDIYTFENAYRDPSGEVIMLVRDEAGNWKQSLRDNVREEMKKSPVGGQFYSFDAVFSPRDRTGKPAKLFKRTSGKIDRDVAEYWKRYDLSLILRENWATLGPKLAGKIHIYCGLLDTYRLEGAAKLLELELTRLGADVEFVFVPGLDHNTLKPHAEHWPKGWLDRVHREMIATVTP